MSSIHGPGSATPISQPKDLGLAEKVGQQGKLSGHKVEVSSGVRLQTTEPNISAKPPKLTARSVSKDKGPVDLKLRHEARFRALPTKGQLLAKAGKPKDDINFWIFGTKKMSTGYKALLKGLDDHHQAMQTAGAKGQPSMTELQELRDHLATLKEGADQYDTKKSHSNDTRKTEIHALNYQVRAQLKTLDRVLNQMKAGGQTWPQGVGLKDGLLFASQGVALNDLAATLAQDQENSAMSLETLQPYRDAGFSGTEARLLEESGLGLEGGEMFQRCNLKVSPETLPKSFRSSNETSFKELDSGKFNTVYEVNYNSSAGDKVGVFKPLPKVDGHKVEGGWVAKRIGVDTRNPQIALRNIATMDVAKTLGFNVVPETSIAEHGGKLGILMDKAPGETGRSTDKALYDDPGVRRELTKLQLLDALVGQGDRHHGNYFIDRSSTGAVTVTGVDNDQCFGWDLRNPNDLLQGRSADNRGFRGVKLPPVVDTDMYAALMIMTTNDLDQLLGGKLKPGEVSAAKDRLGVMQSHLRDLADPTKPGRIIAPDEWGSEGVKEMMDKTNSYAARDGRWGQPVLDPRQEELDAVLKNLNLA